MKKANVYLLVLAAFIVGVLSSTLATLAIIETGVIHAEAPASNSGVIYACIRSNGSIRIVSASQSCGSNETTLQWNVQGPAGGNGLPFICSQCAFQPGSSGTLGNRLAGKDLTNAYIAGSSMRQEDLSGTNLTNANLRYDDFLGADFSNANLTNADFTHSDLTNANMSGAIVNGVIWSSTTCPDGTISDNDGGTCVGHF